MFSLNIYIPTQRNDMNMELIHSVLINKKRNVQSRFPFKLLKSPKIIITHKFGGKQSFLLAFPHQYVPTANVVGLHNNFIMQMV